MCVCVLCLYIYIYVCVCVCKLEFAQQDIRQVTLNIYHATELVRLCLLVILCLALLFLLVKFTFFRRKTGMSTQVVVMAHEQKPAVSFQEPKIPKRKNTEVLLDFSFLSMSKITGKMNEILSLFLLFIFTIC